MKLESIQDIDKLPSVLDIEEVSRRLIELVGVIRAKNHEHVESEEAINDLISYQGYNETGLNLEASRVVLDWIKETYDSNNKELIVWHSGNLANLTCHEAKDFIESRLNLDISDFERQELVETLKEIDVKI